MIKNKAHEFFMDKALLQAKVALKKNEVPVGAVVVDSDGNILARGYNKIESTGCQTAHAEVLAIQKACKKIGGWRLDDCWIYVTLEPCLMCLGLIQLSRMKGVVFGASSDLFGFGYGKKEDCRKYKKDLIIKGGLKEQQSIDILKKFFERLRKKRKGDSGTKSRIARKGQKKVIG